MILDFVRWQETTTSYIDLNIEYAFTAEKFEISLHKNESIGNLRIGIQEASGLDPGQQKLFYAGQMLVDTTKGQSDKWSGIE